MCGCKGRIAQLTVFSGLLVLLTTAVLLKDTVLEKYYLSQLKSADEVERETAARELGEMGSVKAIADLLEIFRTEGEYRGLHYSAEALVKIGPRGVRALKEANRDAPGTGIDFPDFEVPQWKDFPSPVRLNSGIGERSGAPGESR